VTTIVVKSKQFELSAETRQAIAETTYLKHDFWEIENETGDLLSVAKACNHGVKCAPQRRLRSPDMFVSTFSLPQPYAYYLFLNQDVQLFDGALERMIDAAAENPRIGIVGPREVIIDQKTTTRLSQHGRVCTFNDQSTGFRWQFVSKSTYTDGLCGFALLVRRECFSDIGGFTEDTYRVAAEDIDICWKAKQKRWLVYYEHGAEVFHVRGSAEQLVSDIGTSKQDRETVVSKIRASAEPARKVLHVLGLAHTRANEQYAGCAFTTLTRFFCKAMRRQGYEVIFYGTEGATVDCDEFVNVQPDLEFRKRFPTNDQHKYQYDYSNERGGWSEFNRRCREQLQKRLPTIGKEIVCFSFGGYQTWLNEMPNAIPVDILCGHRHPITKYTVYPSRTWRSFVYGERYQQVLDSGKTPEYWFDCTIPHFLDPDEYEFSTADLGYALFVGRLPNFDKGLFQAISLCSDHGIPLKIGGIISKEGEQTFYDAIKDHPNVEFVGSISGQKKRDLFRDARVLICPSYYNEPFGLVAIEAAASGTPVICTNWGAFSETVVHGKTGFHVAMYDDFRHSMERIGEIKPEDCWDWFNANFTLDVAGPKYAEYFARILALECGGGNLWYRENLPAANDLFRFSGDHHA